MTPRALPLSIVFALLSAPFSAEAQLPAKIARVGVLSPGPAASPSVEAFRQGLRDLGYIEGQNIILEYRYGEWKPDRLHALAAELVRLKPDVIFTHMTPGVIAAQKSTTTIPIVVGPAGDLVQRGVVASLARPGGNITGLTLIASELEPKRLQLLKETAPKVSRVAVLVNPANPAWDRHPQAFESAARILGVRLQRAEARNPGELEGAFSAIAKNRGDALLVVNDAMFNRHQKQIVDLAGKIGFPTVSESLGFAQAGGLIEYGPSTSDMARRAATLVDKILKGAKPADLPVEQPTKFELVVNLKTAKALGITIPQSVLIRADHVIQ